MRLDKKDMVMVGSMDFSGYKDDYYSLEKEVKKNKKLTSYMYFDDTTQKVWIIWRNQGDNEYEKV